MKTCFCLFILVMLLAACSGCTSPQTASNKTTAAPTTPASPTEAATTVSTPVPTTALPTSVPATEQPTTAAPVTSAATAAATPSATVTASVAVTIIHIRNNTFVPAELIVLPGTGITWINDDSVIHTVKATGNATGKFTSGELINGASFLYTFGASTGTYEFGDPKYPAMTGKIIVEKAPPLWVQTLGSP